MANELTVNVSLNYSKGNDALRREPGAKLVTVSGTKRISSVQALSTSAEQITIGEVGTAGYAYFRNLDATNNISLGLDSDAAPAFCTLKPGEFAVLRLASATLYAVAAAGTPSLAYDIFED